MSKTAWMVIAVVLALLLGLVALGMVVALYSWVDAPQDHGPEHEMLMPEPPGGDEDSVPAPRPEPAPTLRGVEAPTDSNMNRRLAALEAEVKSLRDELAKERAATKPMRDMFEQAKKGGFIGPDGPGMPVGGIPDGAEVVMDDSMLAGAALAKKLAGGMGLEGDRATAFGKAYDDFLGKVQALEKEHAKVAKDGDTTTITIPRLGQAGDQLRREWDDYVDGALSADEKKAYDKGGTRNRLLGARAGDWARTITIKEAGGSIDVREQGDDGKGGKSEQHMQGPAMARDIMLKDYEHLLK